MKLMKLTISCGCHGERKTIYINPARIICIGQGAEGTYLDCPYDDVDSYYQVMETVEEVVRIWEDAING